MPEASEFQGMLSSVIGSQDGEVTLARQAVLSDYGREVRALVSALPPEVSKGLMSEYREPSPKLVAQMEGAITTRELAIEGAAQEANLDQAWLKGGSKDIGTAAERANTDEWNIGPE